MRAKICGITVVEDVLAAAKNGAWAVGFNFHPGSPRFLNLAQALRLSAHVSSYECLKIGIAVEHSAVQVVALIETLGLDYMQVYRHYTCEDSLYARLIVTIQPRTVEDIPPIKVLSQYYAIVVDAPKVGNQIGGTGQRSDWSIAAKLAQDFRLILAGGLNCKNLPEAISAVKPYAVDACSAIEESPGKKDPNALAAFLKLSNSL